MRYIPNIIRRVLSRRILELIISQLRAISPLPRRTAASYRGGVEHILQGDDGLMPGTRVLLHNRDYNDGSWRRYRIKFISIPVAPVHCCCGYSLRIYLGIYIYIQRYRYTGIKIYIRVIFTAHRAIGAYNIMIRPTCSIYA